MSELEQANRWRADAEQKLITANDTITNLRAKLAEAEREIEILNIFVKNMKDDIAIKHSALTEARAEAKMEAKVKEQWKAAATDLSGSLTRADALLQQARGVGASFYLTWEESTREIVRLIDDYFADKG